MSDTAKAKDRSEHRWPAVVGLLIALGLYAALPSAFLPAVRYTVVAIGLLMLIPLLILNPRRLHKETRWSKRLATGQALLLVAANGVALVQLIILLTASGSGSGNGNQCHRLRPGLLGTGPGRTGRTAQHPPGQPPGR
jgi:uncharacterized membrane protein